MTEKRPVYLNLFKIRLPSTGIVSFAHRVSGFLLFLAIPFSIYLLDLSVGSQQRFDEVTDWLQNPLLQIILLIIAWALIHHFLAGIRYLLLDFDVGVDKAGSTLTAWIVLAGELLIVAALAWGLLA